MSIYGLLLKHKDILPVTLAFDVGKISIPNYLVIAESSINVFGIDVLSRLKNNDPQNWDMFEKYFLFLDRIKGNIVRLNHIGFGYKVEDIAAELEAYRKQMGKGFEIVEEDSGDKENNRWFFLKTVDGSLPKTELILYSTDKYKDFCPQFQIDLDTNLSYDELKKTAEELLGKDFFFWSYNVPGYGVVMAMGKIGQIEGIKILVGLGTNLRKPQTFKSI